MAGFSFSDAFGGSSGGYGSAAGTLLSDVSGSLGASASAKVLTANANDARNNAEITKNSSALNVVQQQRKAYQILGGQKADIAGAGLANSGSALDVMRSS